jgi:riboflavin kinase/FMN adenylyltransferase
MRLIECWETLVNLPCGRMVCSIGNFDGLHPGHLAVLDAAVALAREHAALFCVLTFTRNTRQVLYPEAALGSLTTPAERRAGIQARGAAYLAEIPFSPELAAMEPHVFLESLSGRRTWTGIVVGDDFAFGRERRGNVSTIVDFFREKNGSALIIPQYEVEGERVSSSLIREQLMGGRVEAASRLLGRPYTLAGVRERGDGIGAGLGFPTVNLGEVVTLLPGDGVYAVLFSVAGGPELPGMGYVGVRPTLGTTHRVVECHVLDRTLEVAPGTPVRLAFLKHLRGDMHFPDLARLSAQLREDAAAAGSFFRERD